MGKDLFKKPRMVAEAMKAQEGAGWIKEVLIFVAVFFVGNMAMSLIQTPAQLIAMFTSKDYIDAAKTGDYEAIMAAVEQLYSNDLFMVAVLLSNAMLILVTCLFCKWFQRRKMSTLGFVKKGLIKEYLIGLVVGFVMFSGAVLIAVATGAIEFNGISPTFSVVLFLVYTVGFMIQGMAEEVFCRGYFMISYARKYPVYAAIIANSLAFAALHLGNNGITVLSFVNLVLFGVFASVYFVRRGSIWGIGALHTIWNLVQGNFYGIKVSGMTLSNSVLDSTMVEGGELFNGGEFGLEGSISVTIVLVVATVIMYFMKDKDKFEFDPELYKPEVVVPLQPMYNQQMMNGQMYNPQMMNGQMYNPQMMNQQMYNPQMMNGQVPLQNMQNAPVSQVEEKGNM